jgi:hypothetical protein
MFQLYKQKLDSNSEREVGLTWPLMKSFGGRFIFSNVVAFLHYTIVFVSPQVIAFFLRAQVVAFSLSDLGMNILPM